MKHIHFIGIGGIGVSGIAQLALQRGDVVSGSDIKESRITSKLSKLGAKFFQGHSPNNIAGADLVVYSSAIRKDNPEMVEAIKRGIPIMRRAEFLSELMAQKKVITVTGAHGKTTTSSLAAKLLLETGFNPTVAVGGIFREDGDNAKFAKSDYFVAEADESDGTFLCYKPTYSIITNIDREHMDFYKTYENLLASFEKFVKQTVTVGCVFYCHEDEVLKKIVKNSAVRGVSFGFSSEADINARDICLAQCHLSFSVYRKNNKLGDISAALMGRHNVLNILAVVGLGLELGLSLGIIKKAIAGFRGVERRFQVKRDDENIIIVDDYAHHPTEISATIDAAKIVPNRRLVVVFQPHRYSRTESLLDDFSKCFNKSDYLVITDIYAAGEEPVAGIDARKIVDNIRLKTKQDADYVPKDRLIEHLKDKIKRNDLVLFLGAGDITKISDEFSKSF